MVRECTKCVGLECIVFAYKTQLTQNFTNSLSHFWTSVICDLKKLHVQYHAFDSSDSEDLIYSRKLITGPFYYASLFQQYGLSEKVLNN